MKKEIRDRRASLPESVRLYMASLGRKGGKAKGEKKRRSPEFYALLARKGVEARQRKRKEKGNFTPKTPVVDSKSVDTEK